MSTKLKHEAIDKALPSRDGRVHAFKTELKALLKKHNATIGGNTYGCDEVVLDIEVGGNYWEELDTDSIDQNTDF